MNDSQRRFIERIARDHGIPETLSDEIVKLAHTRLHPDGDSRWLRKGEVAQAVDEARREWGGRLSAALDAFVT